MRTAALARTALTSATLTLAPMAAQLPAATVAAADEPVIHLNQAWSDDDREWFYHFSQGSALVSYDIFLNMEAAGSEELFRADANIARFGLIPEEASAYNPDGLAIGIAKTTIAPNEVKGWEPEEYAGVTCAACHETDLSYKGKRVRIDAGVNKADMASFFRALDDAMQTTLTDSARFDRLATRLKADGRDGKDRLRKRLERDAGRIHSIVSTLPTPTSWGPGRFDALTFISNLVQVSMAGLRENWNPGTAPVKPPFLWNSPHGEWAQWNAIIQSPIARNLGEAVGSYMAVDLHSKTPAEGLFTSNAALGELQRVESQLDRLAPPSWPEEVFGKIDRDKAKAGKALFVEYCSGCHNAWPYRWSEPNKFGKRFILVGLVPEVYVGTDPQAFAAISPFALSGRFAEYLPEEFRGKDVVPSRVLQPTFQHSILETAIRTQKVSQEQLLELNGYRVLPQPRPPERVWKAAPRDGVWATAPFLHNGSVPNLYEMLIPASERTKKFCVGREFDPVKVGLDITSCSPGAFVMDTALLGNSNAGHSFQDGPRGNGIIGPLLKDDERWALVEYLKSIPEEPGRVTPYGGPP
jgi:hypothetical protein